MHENSPYARSGDLPLTLEPGDDSADRVDDLCHWLRSHESEVQELLRRHGAVRFRGFAVSGPEDFERIARAIDEKLGSDYLGTSPRDPVEGHVFNASELPPFFPIPQHCEMSFCARPPSRLFFCCLEEPAEGSGETPLCDFRKVWRDLDPDVRDRFVEKGLRIVRNYTAEADPDSDDPTMLKPWSEMFETHDRAEVERQCAAEGFEVTWLEDDALRLVHSQPVYRDHPETGERVWHNHLTTFHVSTAAAEYERIAALRPTDRHRGLLTIARNLEEKLRAIPSEAQAMHTTHEDGSEIDAADVEAVRDVV